MGNAWILKPLPISSASASSSAAGAPLNVDNDYAGIVWRAAAGDSAVLQLDLGADMAMDTLMLFGLRGGFAAGTTVQIALATAAQGAAFSGANTGSGTGAGNYWGVTQALLAGSVLPVSGLGFALWSAPTTGGPPGAVRHVRLGFSGIGAANTIEVARAVTGKRIQLERNFDFGGTFGVRDLGSLDFSARGVLLRRRARKLRTCALTFSHIRKDEVEAMVRPLIEQIGNTEPIALLTDPAADAQRQNRAYFGPIVGDLGQAWAKADRFEAKANIVSIF